MNGDFFIMQGANGSQGNSRADFEAARAGFTALCRDVLLELPEPPALPGDAHTQGEQSRSQKAAETTLCTARFFQSLV